MSNVLDKPDELDSICTDLHLQILIYGANNKSNNSNYGENPAHNSMLSSKLDEISFRYGCFLHSLGVSMIARSLNLPQLPNTLLFRR